MRFGRLGALAATVAAASAQTKGFNYGSTNTDGSPVTESQYESLFKTAQGLVGASGFSSARLFTLIQPGTVNTPSAAIQAAINTKTSLLLGFWASAGQAGIDNEIAAMKSALSTYGSAFTDLIDAISVGSEDLYRTSQIGIENNSGIGTGPSEIASYIRQVKSALSGTAAGSKPVGHVDTWTAWVNGSNAEVIAATDFIGNDLYPYFQYQMPNSIDNALGLFNDAYGQTLAVSQGKPVWITETGWPVSGPNQGQGVPGLDNAKTYWDEVGCGKLFGKVNTWWYTLQDAFPSTPSPSFGVVGTQLSTTPLYDLSCSGASSAKASSASAKPVSSQAAASAVAGGKAGADKEASAIATGAASAQTAASGATSAAAGGSGKSTSAPAVGSGGSASAPAEGSNAGSGSGSTVYTSLVTCPATVIVAGSETKTIYSTSAVLVTGTPASNPAPNTLITKTTVLPAASSGACPASLSGQFEYPHLIVPVNKDKPTTAYGTSYNGTVSPSISSIFNFDVPASYADKTCSLVFFLPTQDKLTTSAFSLSGSGGIDVTRLSSPATEQTTYDTVSGPAKDFGGPSSVTPGNEYVVGSGPCQAGKRVGYLVTATGSLSLNYFQDYNPSPIGLFVTVC